MSDFATIDDIVTALAGADTGGAGGSFDLNLVPDFTHSGGYVSMWKAPGARALGATPTTWAHPTANTPGSWSHGLANHATKTLRLLSVRASASSGNLGSPFLLVDRVGHMGGLDFSNTGVQTVGASLTAAAADGRCKASGVDVLWGVETYTATGAGSTSSCNVAVTYDDDTTGTLNWGNPGTTAVHRVNWAAGVADLPAGKKGIKAISTLQIGTSTGGAGNVGITAYRPLCYLFPENGLDYTCLRDFYQTALALIGNNTCLQALYLGNSPTIKLAGLNIRIGGA